MTNTAIEVSGCYHHAHDHSGCCLTEQNDRGEEHYRAQMEKIAFLKAAGFNVVHVWECQLKRMYDFNTDGYADFMNKYFKFSEEKKTFAAIDLLNRIEATGDGTGDPHTQYFGESSCSAVR